MFKRSLGLTLGFALVGTTLVTGFGGGFASAVPAPSPCFDRTVTIVASDAVRKGTSSSDVIFIPSDYAGTFNAGGGNDFICNASNLADVSGGSGNDSLAGVGILRGDAGNDTINLRTNILGEGSLEAYGGAGNDSIGASNADYVDGGAGNDFVNASYTTETHGGSGDDALAVYWYGAVYGDSGNDSMTFDVVDFADCGSGRDTYFANPDANGEIIRCEIDAQSQS